MGSVRRFRAVVVDSSPSARSFVLGFGASCSRTLCTIVEAQVAKIEQKRAYQQFAEDHAERVDVGARVDVFADGAGILFCLLHFRAPKSIRGAALFWLQGRGGALFGVGHERGEARGAMERLGIWILFDGEVGIGGGPGGKRTS